MTDRDERMGEIRGLVAKEKAGEPVSDRYASARLLDATVWLLSEIDRLREIEEAARDLFDNCDTFDVDQSTKRLTDHLDRLKAKLEGEDD